jgi:DNA-binding XRE family transcriptional regulator
MDINMEAKKLIYALKCPFTNSIHYIGKSTQGMIRPLQHLKQSHSEKINQWVNELKQIGHCPSVEVIEYVNVNDDIDVRERYWIQKELNNGAYLLNSFLISPLLISHNLEQILSDGEGLDMLKIGTFVKEKRKQIKMTQFEFSERFAIALTVIRKIEQGKSNIRLDGLFEVLHIFGCTIEVARKR